MLNQVVFNGRVLNNLEGIFIKSISTSLIPSREIKRLEKAYGNGSYFNGIKNNERIHNISIEVLDRVDKESFYDMLSAIIYTEKEEELIVRDRKYKAILEGSTTLEYLKATDGVELTFISTDPIPFTDVIINSISGDTVIYINSTYKTKPKFSFDITSNVNHIKITNLDNGKFVYVEHDFKIGDKVEVDFDDKWKVRKKGVVIAEDIWLESTFFYLETGENNIRVNVPATLEYKKRWLR